MIETVNQADVDSSPCPRCEGKGGIPNVVRLGGCIATFDFEDCVPCIFCDGKGHVSPAKAQAYVRGREMRADRIERGLSLREEAARLGIDPRVLNDRERGREEKEQVV